MGKLEKNCEGVHTSPSPEKFENIIFTVGILSWLNLYFQCIIFRFCDK